MGDDVIERCAPSNLGHAPCPFCGGTDIALVRRADTYPPSYFGMCMGCGAEGPRIDSRFAARHPSGRRYYWQDRPAEADLLAERDRLRAEVERLRTLGLSAIRFMQCTPLCAAIGGYGYCSCGQQDLRAALAQVERLQDHIESVAKDTQRLLMERDAEVERLREIVCGLIDDEPCQFDHHGHCQTHGWPYTDPQCPVARGRAALAEKEAGE